MYITTYRKRRSFIWLVKPQDLIQKINIKLESPFCTATTMNVY